MPTLNAQFTDALHTTLQLAESNAPESDHARCTDEIISAINATGEAFFTGSNWKSRRVMRISVCNWRTTASDVDRAVSAAALVLHAFTVHDALNRPIPS